jgi:tetratricopeptide (TPR) repeat protein
MRKTLVLCMGMLALAAGNAFAGAEARLTGKIVDAKSKAPIAGAKIVAKSVEGKNLSQDTTSKKDGTYALFLLDGTIRYRIVFSAPGHDPVEETMKLQIGGQANVKDVELPAEGSTGKPAAAAAAAPPAPDPGVTAYNEAASLANEGKLDEAVKKMEEAATKKADFIAAYQALSRLYIRQKNYPKAIEAGEKALSYDPDDTDMHAVLFEAYSASGNKAKAEELKKKLPANAAALFNDAARLLNDSKDGQAEPLLKQAIAADPNMAQAYYELGMIYVRSGNKADARTNLQKYLELKPDGKDAATAKEMLAYVK